MNFNTDPKWLERQLADGHDDNISVGGLITQIDKNLTPVELLERLAFFYSGYPKNDIGIGYVGSLVARTLIDHKYLMVVDGIYQAAYVVERDQQNNKG